MDTAVFGLGDFCRTAVARSVTGLVGHMVSVFFMSIATSKSAAASPVLLEKQFAGAGGVRDPALW